MQGIDGSTTLVVTGQARGEVPGAAAALVPGGGPDVGAQGAPPANPSAITLDPNTGQACRTAAAGPDPAAAAAAQGIPAWHVLLAGIPACSGQAAGPAPQQQLSPQQIAASFIDTLTPPDFSPTVAPGWAITGKTAYLETRAQTAQAYAFDTPLGGLAVQAIGRSFTVDWGDGTVQTYDSPGGPWPNGRVTHVYETEGSRTIRVTEHWSATWSLAGQSGTVDGLRSTGTIPGLPVRQLQAQRER